MTLRPVLVMRLVWQPLEATNSNSWVEVEPPQTDPTDHAPAPASRVLLLPPRCCRLEGLGSSPARRRSGSPSTVGRGSQQSQLCAANINYLLTTLRAVIISQLLAAVPRNLPKVSLGRRNLPPWLEGCEPGPGSTCGQHQAEGL